MFTGGDFDLNLVRRYPSPKEVIRQAMLNQEHIFGMQANTRLPVNGLQEQRVVFEQKLFNHINHENLVKENSFLCSRKPIIETRQFFRDDVRPSEEVDLALSIGWNKQRKAAYTKTWDHIINLEESNETTQVACKKTWDHIINLEGSSKTMLCEEVNPPVKNLRGNHDVSSTHYPNKNQSEWTKRSHSSLLEQRSSSKGVTQCFSVLIPERKHILSDERVLIDLNKHPDELSFYVSDLGSASSSTRTFLRDSHGMIGGSPKDDTSHTALNRRDQVDDDCSNETSGLQKDSVGTNCLTSRSSNLYSSLTQVLENYGTGEGQTSKLESEGANLSLESKNGSYTDLPSQAANVSNHIEDARFSDECMEVDESLISCKSNSAAKPNSQSDNASSSGAAKSPCQEDAESSGNNDLDLQTGDDQRGKPAEVVDKEVRKGAVSLLYYVLECTRDHQSCSKNTEQPQRSMDTFESMVLKMPESKMDDDSCVSSKAYEVDITNSSTDCGIAVRRGRRMKDFRRYILPNLASLSRHEISEDINIMESVLRSREYKKIMSTMKGVQKCFMLARSKRSRLNHVAQKHHS